MKRIFYLLIALLVYEISSAQNVGIGTTTPDAKLDIIGTLKVTDDMK
jgi:hypothetical protein